MKPYKITISPEAFVQQDAPQTDSPFFNTLKKVIWDRFTSFNTPAPPAQGLEEANDKKEVARGLSYAFDDELTARVTKARAALAEVQVAQEEAQLARVAAQDPNDEALKAKVAEADARVVAAEAQVAANPMLTPDVIMEHLKTKYHCSEPQRVLNLLIQDKGGFAYTMEKTLRTLLEDVCGEEGVSMPYPNQFTIKEVEGGIQIIYDQTVTVSVLNEDTGEREEIEVAVNACLNVGNDGQISLEPTTLTFSDTAYVKDHWVKALEENFDKSFNSNGDVASLDIGVTDIAALQAHKGAKYQQDKEELRARNKAAEERMAREKAYKEANTAVSAAKKENKAAKKDVETANTALIDAEKRVRLAAQEIERLQASGEQVTPVLLAEKQHADQDVVSARETLSAAQQNLVKTAENLTAAQEAFAQVVAANAAAKAASAQRAKEQGATGKTSVQPTQTRGTQTSTARRGAVIAGAAIVIGLMLVGAVAGLALAGVPLAIAAAYVGAVAVVGTVAGVVGGWALAKLTSAFASKPAAKPTDEPAASQIGPTPYTTGQVLQNLGHKKEVPKPTVNAPQPNEGMSEAAAQRRQTIRQGNLLATAATTPQPEAAHQTMTTDAEHASGPGVKR